VSELGDMSIRELCFQ